MNRCRKARCLAKAEKNMPHKLSVATGIVLDMVDTRDTKQQTDGDKKGRVI